MDLLPTLLGALPDLGSLGGALVLVTVAFRWFAGERKGWQEERAAWQAERAALLAEAAALRAELRGQRDGEQGGRHGSSSS